MGWRCSRYSFIGGLWTTLWGDAITDKGTTREVSGHRLQKATDSERRVETHLTVWVMIGVLSEDARRVSEIAPFHALDLI
jgi:hypothetical protein